MTRSVDDKLLGGETWEFDLCVKDHRYSISRYYKINYLLVYNIWTLGTLLEI